MTLFRYHSENLEIEIGVSRIEKRKSGKFCDFRKLDVRFPGCRWRFWQFEIFNRFCIYLETEKYVINAELSAVKKQKQENKK